jgi:hypothetical protein
MSLISTQLGDPDEAFKWLATARRVRDPGLSLLLTDPMVDPLRKDPRFAQLVRGLRLEVVAGR